MVKGTSRRVIVVDSPDTELFEQAIFIVRNDAMNRNGVTAQRLVDEACRVARTCGRTATCSKRSFFRRGSPALWGCIGAGMVTQRTHLVHCFFSSVFGRGEIAAPDFFAQNGKSAQIFNLQVVINRLYYNLPYFI